MDTTAATGLTFRDATDADVDALVALIESAYRGDSSRTGLDHRGGHPRRAADRPARACSRSSSRRTAGC